MSDLNKQKRDKIIEKKFDYEWGMMIKEKNLVDIEEVDYEDYCIIMKALCFIGEEQENKN